MMLQGCRMDPVARRQAMLLPVSGWKGCCMWCSSNGPGIGLQSSSPWPARVAAGAAMHMLQVPRTSRRAPNACTGAEGAAAWQVTSGK